MSGVTLEDTSRKALGVLAVLAAVGLAGHALAYLVVIPDVGSGGFIPTSIGDRDGTPSTFSTVLAGFALLYAFAFLPVAFVVTVRRYQVAPATSLIAACLAGLSSVLEIVNNLPVLASGVYRAGLADVPDDVSLRFLQTDAIRYLALDVAGFTLAYLALVVYSVLLWRSRRWPVYAVAASVALFAVNVPFLWFSPEAAVVLMAASILVLAVVVMTLGRIAVKHAD